MGFSPAFVRPFIPPFSRAVSAGVALLILDQFTDADGTSLDAHAIAPTNVPGTSWTERASAEGQSNWAITGNQAYITTAAQDSSATCNTGKADCVLSASVISISASTIPERDAGLSVRNLAYRVSISNSANAFRIVETSGMVVGATAAVAIAFGPTYLVAATLSGATITATVDGANTITYASATTNQTSGVHGIKCSYTQDKLDNFTVTG